MQAVVFCFVLPVLPLLLARLYNKEKESKYLGGPITRYLFYTLIMNALSTVIMLFMSRDGSSFLEKMDHSPEFMIKFFLLQLVLALAIAFAEWAVHTGKISILIDSDKYSKFWLTRFIKKLVGTFGIYILALGVVLLNASLMFDNVLWGDEAFSANTIRASFAGIIQILYYCDNHPPLFYFWLKICAELLGYKVWVYHFASMVPFVIGIIMALTFFRKRFGKLPAALFILISGLAAPCVEYNQEVRMYAVAFLALAGCFYCAYRVLCGGKLAWFGMVIWALIGAYAHYYALVAAGILIVVTAVIATIRYRKLTWLKGLIALVVYIVAYIPWLRILLKATKEIAGGFWMTEPASVKSVVTLMFGGDNICKVTLPLFVLIIVGLFLLESSIFTMVKSEGKYQIKVTTPSAKKWSGENLSILAGVLTIIGTFTFAYGFSYLKQPILAARYAYPICAMILLMIMMGSGNILKRLSEFSKDKGKKYFIWFGRVCMLVVLCVILFIGIKDFKAYRSVVKDEKAKTEDVLTTVGTPAEGEKMVTTGVKHLGYTVLAYYYPNNEVVNASCLEMEDNSFWYFCGTSLDQGTIDEMQNRGYTISGYGEKQLCKYPCVIYYFTK